MNDTENGTSDVETMLEGHLYKLAGKKPVPCSFAEYIAFMKSAENRIIEQNQIGNLLVSTIFTGLDSTFGSGEMKLFETKIFGLPDDVQPRWLFSSWNQAVREHRKIVVSLETEGAKAILSEISEAKEPKNKD